MKTFLKYFTIALITQIIIILLALFAGIGDLPLIPYMMVFEIVGALFPNLPKQIGGDSLIVLIALMCAPAVLYSIIFASIMCIVKKFKTQKVKVVSKRASRLR